MRNPKFEQAINSKINTQQSQQTSDGYGIILDYDVANNTATIALADPGSDQLGEILREVPCPVTIGLQVAAPEPGRPCWVAFKNGSSTFPVVTHFFNHVYNDVDYARQTKATNPIPRYMLAM